VNCFFQGEYTTKNTKAIDAIWHQNLENFNIKVVKNSIMDLRVKGKLQIMLK